MTRYTVVWHPQAQNELAQIWLSVSDRNAVSSANHQVDSYLSTDAEIKGTPILGELRELIIPPLHVIFGLVANPTAWSR